MVRLSSLQDFVNASADLYQENPSRTRYSLKIRAAPPKSGIVWKATDGKYTLNWASGSNDVTADCLDPLIQFSKIMSENGEFDETNDYDVNVIINSEPPQEFMAEISAKRKKRRRTSNKRKKEKLYE